MKKTIGILAMLLLCFSFSGCKSSNSAVKDTGSVYLVAQHTEPTDETTVPETTVPSTATQPTTETEPFHMASFLPIGEGGMEFYFMSGAGAWRTLLMLHADGSFAGQFTDSDMGIAGEDYPYGTVYVCDFLGCFRDIEQLDEHSYKMTLWYVQTQEIPDEEWIEDGTRYIAADPYGISGGQEFILHLPDTPIEELSEDFLSWWPYRYTQQDDPKTTLSCYGIENISTGDGFFAQE